MQVGTFQPALLPLPAGMPWSSLADKQTCCMRLQLLCKLDVASGVKVLLAPVGGSVSAISGAINPLAGQPLTARGTHQPDCPPKQAAGQLAAAAGSRVWATALGHSTGPQHGMPRPCVCRRLQLVPQSHPPRSRQLPPQARPPH